MLAWLQDHYVEAAILVAAAIVNGLRLAWPLEEERPRWVRFTLGFLDPVALNFWGPRKAMALAQRNDPAGAPGQKDGD